MMFIITSLLKSLLLGWLIYAYKPLKDIRSVILSLLTGWTKGVFNYVFSFIDCWKCSSAITCFILTQDIYLTSASAILAFKLDRHINTIKL